MHDARNLRSSERFLLAPPLAARFGSDPVAVCDISERGARFRHERPMQAGLKSLLQMAVEGALNPLTLEAAVIWSEADPSTPGRFISGVRTYAEPETVRSLISDLTAAHRTSRIEELRASDRFFLRPSLEGQLGDAVVLIENLSARGSRVESATEIEPGTVTTLRFTLPDVALQVAVPVRVIWSSVKAITGGDGRSFRIGMTVTERCELIRLAIGQLCESGQAQLDTQSLRLKLKIFRARARELASSYPDIESSGIPAEQYLLVQGVREELRLNPEESVHWYRRARLMILDPAMRSVAPAIASHPDALAVWEYLDRSVDATIVGRVFELH
jgi:hypothetical protein